MLFEITGLGLISLFIIAAFAGIIIYKSKKYITKSFSFLNFILDNRKKLSNDLRPEILLGFMAGLFGGILGGIIITLVLNIDIITRIIKVM